MRKVIAQQTALCIVQVLTGFFSVNLNTRAINLQDFYIVSDACGLATFAL